MMTRRTPSPPLFPYTTLFRSPPLEDDAALLGIDQAHDGLGKGRLSAAGLAHNAEGFALGEGQRDIVEGPRSEETRLNSSHGYISYAVFCLKKKNSSTISPPLL